MGKTIEGEKILNNYHKEKDDRAIRFKLNFLDELFNGKLQSRIVARIMNDGGYDRIVSSKWPNERVLSVIPEETASKFFDDYLAYLYSLHVREVKWADFFSVNLQAMVKAILAYNDELKLNQYKKDGGNSIISIERPDMDGSGLYWASNDVPYSLQYEYLKEVRKEYKEATKDQVNALNLYDLYGYFVKNPNPEMKVLKLSETSGIFID